jgi:tetratricopeptide (TPR) repeat protein
MGFMDKLGGFLKAEKSKTTGAEQYLNLVQKEPGNAKAHLKLAEIYQKKGEKQKAVSEYLLAADIFSKNNFYARAMAIYKQVPKQDPSLDHVYLKIADIYRKMGFLGDAFAQYRILVQHYDKMGMRDKALEIMRLMAELDPRRKTTPNERDMSLKQAAELPKGMGGIPDVAEATPGEKEDFFDLGAELESVEPMEMKAVKEISNLEKISGVEEIFKELKETSGPSTVDPYFNFNMGMACREMGFFDDAVEQFQIAFEKGQKPFEAAHMLALCFKEKGMRDEARQSFEKALQVEGIPQEKKLNIKYELGLLYKEQGKQEEALELLRQISAVDQRFRDTKDEIVKLTGNIKGRGRSRKKSIKDWGVA